MSEIKSNQTFADVEYLKLVLDIINNGVEKDTRSGKVKSVFGRLIRFDLKNGLPMLTTKKMFSKACIVELLWFLSGDTNIRYLLNNNVHIWDDDAYRYYKETIKKSNEYSREMNEEQDNANQNIEEISTLSKEEFIDECMKDHSIWICKKDENGNKYEDVYFYGDLGDIYGKQWRGFGYSNVDQIRQIIETLHTNPDDRRMICIAYNPEVLNDVALPPCHVMFQFYTRQLPNGKRELSCMWTQRSVDTMLGLPFNILSYAILTHMIAQICNMEVGELVGSLGDCHIYLNQMEGAKEQLTRDPFKYKSPKLVLNKEIKSIDDFTLEDIKIEGYESFDKISFPLSVG